MTATAADARTAAGQIRVILAETDPDGSAADTRARRWLEGSALALDVAADQDPAGDSR